jgi:hypothetical protein
LSVFGIWYLAAVTADIFVYSVLFFPNPIVLTIRLIVQCVISSIPWRVHMTLEIKLLTVRYSTLPIRPSHLSSRQPKFAGFVLQDFFWVD